MARRPFARVWRRASPSGRSARWSAAAPASSRPTTSRRPGTGSPRPCAVHVADPDERRWIERAFLVLLGFESGMAIEELFGAWRTFFERLAATGPVVMVFEDFQHADTGLVDFVDHVMEWSRSVPIFVVTLARPDLLDKRPDWGAAKRSFTSVYLEPLSTDAMRAAARGPRPGHPGVGPHIDRRSGRRHAAVRRRDRPDADRRRPTRHRGWRLPAARGPRRWSPCQRRSRRSSPRASMRWPLPSGRSRPTPLSSARASPRPD